MHPVDITSHVKKLMSTHPSIVIDCAPRPRARSAGCPTPTRPVSRVPHAHAPGQQGDAKRSLGRVKGELRTTTKLRNLRKFGHRLTVIRLMQNGRTGWEIRVGDELTPLFSDARPIPLTQL